MADPGATQTASGETTNALEKTQVLYLGIKAQKEGNVLINLHPAVLQMLVGKI